MADDASALLTQMRSAMHTLNYSGTLVYAQGNVLSTYQVRHANEAGAEKESVVSLEQAGGGQGEVESFSLAKFQQVQPQLEQVYSLDFGGNESVAGHSCRIVVARPRDRMRYLHRYCIDPVSGMLLKYSLTNPAHEVVEQMLFTSLDIASSESVPAPRLARASSVADPESERDSDHNDDWKFTSLPAGFQQTNNLLQAADGSHKPVRQLVLSDGMTSISVFIAPVGSKAQPDAALSAGAMNIFTRKLGKYDVTLVGEVPVATLVDIAKGLRHAD